MRLKNFWRPTLHEKTAFKKILVVGGAGYVGSRLVPRLLKDGHRVTVVDLLWFGHSFGGNVKVIKKNALLLDEPFLKSFDTVVFLAGLSNDPMAEYSPAFNFVLNAAAPMYLAYVAKKAGVKRFIFGDSCSVYGFAPTNSILHEHSPKRSIYAYGLSKLQASLALEHLADKTFSVIQLRKGTVSGWSPRMRFDLLVNTMFKTAMADNKITINNPGVWRPLLAMSDAVEAYTAAVGAPKKISGVFNVSSGNFTVGEVGEKVADFFDKTYGRRPEVTVKNEKELRNYRVSTNKTKKILKVRFRGSVETILKELEKNVGRNFDFNNDRYHNIAVFKKILLELQQKLL